MSRFHSYLNSAISILNTYNGKEPFAAFLKKHFAANKKYGSKDRKQISHLCYCYFRLGKAGSNLKADEKIVVSLLLCSDQPNELLEQLKPEWNEKVSLPLNDKISMLNGSINLTDIFPFTAELSEGIDSNAFIQSLLIQPNLFLRIRPGQEKNVIHKLEQATIAYKQIDDTSIALPNSTKTEDIIELNKEAVIQDLSSQRIGSFLQNIQSEIQNQKSKIKIWDCCAASGGKSILAKDILGDIDLTVSDIRESIMSNLHKRFKEAGISKYHSFIADLSDPKLKIQNSNSQPAFSIPHSPFSIIIADVPCSGSGTWSRTPEQLIHFDNPEINRYSTLQKKIISQVIPHLEQGGYFLYITCSVFRKENEENVAYIKEKFRLDIIKMECLKGYDKKADSMFAALFKKTIAG